MRMHGVAHRLEARAAEAIHGDRRDLVRQAREQHRHARDVAVVLAGLVGRAEDDLIDARDSGGALRASERRDDVRREIVGAHVGEARP